MKRMTGHNLLSTKNARELPKCSKSLHFANSRAATGGFGVSEQAEKRQSEIVRGLRELAVNVRRTYRFRPAVIRRST
jgi:hypothetical protein